MKNLIKNKKGWLAMVEVFISILILLSILTIVLNISKTNGEEKRNNIYEEQTEIIRMIQIDDDLREDIISEKNQTLDSFMKNNLPDYLECVFQICDFNDGTCIPPEISIPEEKEIFVKSILITTDLNVYDPKEFKLFCWEK